LQFCGSWKHITN